MVFSDDPLSKKTFGRLPSLCVRVSVFESQHRWNEKGSCACGKRRSPWSAQTWQHWWYDFATIAVVDRIYRKDFDFMEMAFDAFHRQAFSDGSTTQLSIRESAPIKTSGKPLQTFRAMLQARNKRGECGHEDTSTNGHVKSDKRSSAKRSAETTAAIMKRQKKAPLRQLTLSQTLQRQAASKLKCTTTRQLTLPEMLSRQTCLEQPQIVSGYE